MLKSVSTGSTQVADALRLTPYSWRKSRFLKSGGDENLGKYVATALLRFEKGHFNRKKLLMDIEETIGRFLTDHIDSRHPSNNAGNDAKIAIARRAARHGFTNEVVKPPFCNKLVLQSLLDVEPLEKSVGMNYSEISHLKLLATAAFELEQVNVGLQACNKAIKRLRYGVKNFGSSGTTQGEIDTLLIMGIQGALKASSGRAGYEFLCQEAIWALGFLSNYKDSAFAKYLVLKVNIISQDMLGRAIVNPYEAMDIFNGLADFGSLKKKVEERSSPL